MPRNTEDIVFDIDTQPELDGVVRHPRGYQVWVVHKNTIAVPAGTRRGKCRTPEATKNIQARYWETGIPLGLELELESDSTDSDDGHIELDVDELEAVYPTDTPEPETVEEVVPLTRSDY